MHCILTNDPGNLEAYNRTENSSVFEAGYIIAPFLKCDSSDLGAIERGLINESLTPAECSRERSFSRSTYLRHSQRKTANHDSQHAECGYTESAAFLLAHGDGHQRYDGSDITDPISSYLVCLIGYHCVLIVRLITS